MKSPDTACPRRGQRLISSRLFWVQLIGLFFIVWGWMMSFVLPCKYMWMSHPFSAVFDPFADPDVNASEVSIGNIDGRLMWKEETSVEYRTDESNIRTPGVILRWLRDPNNEFSDGVQLINVRIDSEERLCTILPAAVDYQRPESTTPVLGSTRTHKIAIAYWLLFLFYLATSFVVHRAWLRRKMTAPNCGLP